MGPIKSGTITWMDVFYVLMWFSFLVLWSYTEITERETARKFKIELQELHERGAIEQARKQSAILERLITTLESRGADECD